MKAPNRSLLILAATLIASAALHAEVSPDFQRQIEEMRQLLKPADSDSPAITASKSAMRGLTANLQTSFDQGHLSHFSRYTSENLGGGLASVPGFTEKMEELRQSAQREVLRQNQEDVDKGEALIKEVGEILQSSKKPEDLDGAMVKLSQHKPARDQENPDLAIMSRRIEAASQIVKNWQEYLIAKENGNRQAQTSHLQQVSSALATNPIIPRSIVLRLLSPSTLPTTAGHAKPEAEALAMTLDSITAALTESGDAAAAVAQLKKIAANHLDGSHDMSLLRGAQSIENLGMLEPAMTDAEVIANARTLLQNQSKPLIYNRALDQIVLNSIARTFAIEAPSAKLTSPRKVVEALAESAASSGDWSRLRKAIGTLESLNYGSSAPDYTRRATDLKLLSLLELAKAAEARNDVEAAATAYVEASSLEGFFLSKEIAYGKLTDLKQKAPDKLASILARAQERKQRTEVDRYAAELEARDRMMNRRMMGPDRSQGMPDRASLKPIVQEVVAEFLKEKRLEALPRPLDANTKPNEPGPKTDTPAPEKE